MVPDGLVAIVNYSHRLDKLISSAALVGLAPDVAETTIIPRSPKGRESVPVQISRLLHSHEIVRKWFSVRLVCAGRVQAIQVLGARLKIQHHHTSKGGHCHNDARCEQ